MPRDFAAPLLALAAVAAAICIVPYFVLCDQARSEWPAVGCFSSAGAASVGCSEAYGLFGASRSIAFTVGDSDEQRPRWIDAPMKCDPWPAGDGPQPILNAVRSDASGYSIGQRPKPSEVRTA